MKLVNFYRKPISMFVMVTFIILFCFWANQSPAAPSAPASKKNSEALLENRESESTSFFEQEESILVTKKKFPWLLVEIGIVAVVVLAVLLTKKKNNATTYANGVLTVSNVRYELATIPAGEFQMGSNSGWSEEQPVHTVRISKGFWLGKTEVTQGLYQAVMGSNPSHYGSGDNYPVEEVSWDDCQTFITKLNQLVGGNAFRLPTEAEWEYACRAGTTGDRYGNIDTIAWYHDNSYNNTNPVGQKQANAWGLFDTLGNVLEWCQDFLGNYSAGYQTDPTGPDSGAHRVLRGGSWVDYAEFVRSAVRHGIAAPGYTAGGLGFRLARTNE